MYEIRTMKGYFGTDEHLPALVALRAGKLSCAYELGSLRYIKAGEEEILRRIYPAVRDENWRTIPMRVEDENVEDLGNAFRITCAASFVDGHIRYRASFEITGSDMGQVSYTMRGEAESDFLRNRIGLCVLHPIQECIGQPVETTSLNGTVLKGTFPELVSPHQPFLEISQLDWVSARGAEVQLFFEGEIFEMEDQRNWTDHSFKTYGTPLRLPNPVPVQKGETLCQKVTLRLKSVPMEPIASESTENTLFESDLTAPFPRLGFDLHHEPMDDVVREQLQDLRPDHLRVLLDMTSASWENTFEDALRQAGHLHTRLELVVVLGSQPWQEVVDLVEALTGKDDLINSLSLINEPREVSQDGFLTVAEVLKKYLPQIKIGYATDGFFADLNRNHPPLAPYDFVAFSVNPQVHATDLRTIIENVSAQQYPVQTVRSFGDNAPKIHVSPLTFRIRGQANSHDPRLHTGFGAAITLLSLRYLAGVEQITYYQTHGPDGVAFGEGAVSSSLYDCFQQLREFEPDRIFLTQSPRALVWDALVVSNAAGDKRYFIVNFSTESIRVQLSSTKQEITLPAESITTLRNP